MKKTFLEYLLTTNRLKETKVNSVAAADTDAWEPLGRLALLHRIISPDDIDKILNRQKVGNEYFGQVAVQLNLMSEAQICVLLTGQAIRACVELMETLVLSEVLDLSAGLRALNEFLTQPDFIQRLMSQSHGRM